MNKEDKDYLFTKEKLVGDWFNQAQRSDVGDFTIIYFEYVSMILERTMEFIKKIKE